MKRTEFLKNVTKALAVLPLTRYASSNNNIEEINFIKQYIQKYVDLTDIPDDLDLAERALTAYIHGELSKKAAVKILMFNDNITEEEAIAEIKELDEISEKDKIDYEDVYDDKGNYTGLVNSDNNKNNPKKQLPEEEWEWEKEIHIPFGFGD